MDNKTFILRKSTNQKQNLYSLIIFLIWPFVSFILAFRHYDKTWAKNIVWLFVIFYGYSFVIIHAEADGIDYKLNFISNVNNQRSFSEFATILYNEETQKLDLLEPLISYWLSFFTTDYRMLFAMFGLIFGYFYSRNIWYLLERVSGSITKHSIVFILCFALLNSFWNINGFRFNTALHICLFGLLPFLYEGKKKYLWWVLVAPFVHFSFMVPVVLLIVFILLGNKMNLFFWLMVVSFFLSELNLEWLHGKVTFLPVLFQDKAGSYIEMGFRESVADTRNWYTIIYSYVLKYCTLVLAIFAYYKEQKYILDRINLRRLFSFSLFMLAAANVISTIPSVGRFLILAYLCMFAFFFLLHQSKDQSSSMKRIMPFATPFILFYCIIVIRTGFDFLSFTTVFGNPFTAPFAEGDKALIEFIK